MDVTVIGGGVSGLTCAVALLQAGAQVTVVTAQLPAATVSAVAGAMVGPVFGSGDERRLAWERRSDAVFRELAGTPGTGVRLIAGRLLAPPELGPGQPSWARAVPGYTGELAADRLPEGCLAGFTARLPFADMPAYLAWLLARIATLGGRVQQRHVDDIAALDAEVVINCTGLGAAALTDDTGLEPVWGQQVLVHAPQVREFVHEGGATGDAISIVPQPRGVLLGGVRRPGRTDLAPDHQLVAATVARAARAVPALATAPRLGVEVGIRPGRTRVRLEAVTVGGRRVIHNYGHDGSGVFWSWGCAADVVALCGLGP